MAQPLVILAQLVVAARWEAPYDLARNTISDLGAVGCGTLQAAGGPVEVCSPWHVGMNVSFAVIGSLLALGGLLLVPALRGRTNRAGAAPAGRRTPVGVRVASALLVVAGVSSAAVGFVPLDLDAELHTLVATPLFAAQPVALVLLALATRHRTIRVLLLLTGTVAGLGALAFGATIALGEVGGLAERVALWPCQLGLAVVGLAVLRHADRPVWETAA